MNKSEIEKVIRDMSQSLNDREERPYAFAKMEAAFWELYNERQVSSCKWRESFDNMHQRAMSAEKHLTDVLSLFPEDLTDSGNGWGFKDNLVEKVKAGRDYFKLRLAAARK